MYDRFVAVFRICEAVFRREYNNLKAADDYRLKDRSRFNLKLLERLAMLVNSRNLVAETPKYISDFNK